MLKCCLYFFKVVFNNIDLSLQDLQMKLFNKRFIAVS